MDINIYDLKLREIDKKIDDWNKSAIGRAYQKCKDQQILYNSIFFGGNIGASVYIDGQDVGCDVAKKQGGYVTKLELDRKALVLEMEKEQQHLKDQYLIQQQEATFQAEQATEFARQQALRAAEEVRAAANKTEQEKQIAAQQLQKAQQELAKAKALQAIAKQSEAGSLEAMRISQGINTVSKYKTPLIIGGISLAILVIGFIGYKMLKKSKKV